jgi:hypothetical protein
MPVKVELTFENAFAAKIFDISDSGVFVITPVKLEVGAVVGLIIDGKRFVATVRKATGEDRENGVFGFGAEFGMLTDGQREVVQMIVSRMREQKERVRKTKASFQKDEPAVVLVDNDPTTSYMCWNQLTKGGCNVIKMSSFDNVLELLRCGEIKLIITEYDDNTTMHLREIRREFKDIPICIFSVRMDVPAEWLWDNLKVTYKSRATNTPEKFFNEYVKKII